MSTPFQNRLVGTIIVAAAIIIFLPDILDGEKKSYQADFESIPKAPAFAKTPEKKEFPTEKIVVLPEEKLSEDIALDDTEKVVEPTAEENNKSPVKQQDTDKVKVNVVAKTTNTTVKKQSKESTNDKITKVSTSSNAKAWVIHLGSFKHKKNVDELLAKLKKNGYTAFTKPIKTKNGMLTKVIIGPNLNKKELTKKIPELKKLTNVQGKIARFNTLN